jgi:hypothetical protein
MEYVQSVFRNSIQNQLENDKDEFQQTDSDYRREYVTIEIIFSQTMLRKEHKK